MPKDKRKVRFEEQETTSTFAKMSEHDAQETTPTFAKMPDHNAVECEIKRLGGGAGATYPRRGYVLHPQARPLIPRHIQDFCDSWPHRLSFKTCYFKHEEYNVNDFQFGQEFVMKEEDYQVFPFLQEHSDAIIIGDGAKLVVASMKDEQRDFNIWLLEEAKDSIGPLSISSFLKGLEKVSK